MRSDDPFRRWNQSSGREGRDRNKDPMRPSAARRAFSPRPEVLEGRTLLSTLTVLNGLDGGPGSLRQAILGANTAPGPDTIVFARTVHQINLSGGELAIADDLEILGPGANRLTVSGDDAGRVFHVQAKKNATIAGLTITAGRAAGDSPRYPSTGGGVLNEGNLVLHGVVVAGNRAVGDPGTVVSVNPVFNIAGGAVGGGLANFGTLTVAGSTFADNEALGAADVDASELPFPFSFPGNALGGGLANFGNASITDSQFTGNLARAGSRGIGAFAAIGGGGAILNDASLTVAGSSFRDNQAVGGDGSFSPSHNGHALGGAIMSGSLTALPIIGAVGADLTVIGSEFRHNQALGGNDNRIADPMPPRSEAPNNGYGGGILVYQGSAAIRASTLTHNRAVGGAGGDPGGKGSLGVGGGLFFYNFVGGVTATVEGSTITDNGAIGGDGRVGVTGGDGLGGGVAVGGLGSPFVGPGSVAISDTVIARNLARGGDGGKGGDGGDGIGGGLFSDTSSTVTLTASTVTRNRAQGGHGRAGGRAGRGLGDNISYGDGGQQGGSKAASAARNDDTRVIPFKINGGGTAPLGVPVFPGGTAPHDATGIATHLGKYTGDEGTFELLSIDPVTGTGTFRGTFVFVAANGDRLTFHYGADPDNPGEVTLIPAGDGKVIAVFVAEFTPVPEQSTGRFADVVGGSFVMVATSEPFSPVPNAQGFTAPFAYTWEGEGSLEFSKGKK